MVDTLILVLIIALGVYLGILLAVGSIVGGTIVKDKAAYNRRFGRPWWRNKS